MKLTSLLKIVHIQSLNCERASSIHSTEDGGYELLWVTAYGDRISRSLEIPKEIRNAEVEILMEKAEVEERERIEERVRVKMGGKKR